MVTHWPKTKFIHLFRDEAGWKQSLKGFMTTLHGIPKGAIMDQLFYNNPCMSPTSHHALTTVIEGKFNLFYFKFYFMMLRIQSLWGRTSTTIPEQQYFI